MSQPSFTAKDYLGLLSASVLLSSYADDDAETYGTDADYADRAVTKVWALLPPKEQAAVHEKLGTG